MTESQVPADYDDETPEGDDALATEAVMNTVRTADLIIGRVARLLRPLDVSATGGLVLGLLQDHGPMSPSALGERLIVTRATVTGVVDSLARRGLVTRQPDPHDRRRAVIELSDEGRRTVQQVRAVVRRHERDWMSVLSDDELGTYLEQLHRIQDAIESS